MTDTLILLTAALAVIWVGTRPPRQRRPVKPAPPTLTAFRILVRHPYPSPSPN